MAVEEGGPDGEEVGVAGIVDLNDAPGVLPRADPATANLDDVLRTDNGERHKTPQFSILLNSVLIILFNVVGEVVHGDPVMLDVLHDKLLGLGQLGGGEGVSATNNRDDIDPRSEPLHELDVQFAKACITLDHCCNVGGHVATYP